MLSKILTKSWKQKPVVLMKELECILKIDFIVSKLSIIL